MPKKSSVAFNRRPDPPFIAQFKQRLAYKEGDTIETKVINRKINPIQNINKTKNFRNKSLTKETVI